MGVRSEYQKHFKVSALQKSLPIYYENVAFRTARREKEYAHTPLSWCDDSDTDSIDSDSFESNKHDQRDQQDVPCSEFKSSVIETDAVKQSVSPIRTLSSTKQPEPSDSHSEIMEPSSTDSPNLNIEKDETVSRQIHLDKDKTEDKSETTPISGVKNTTITMKYGKQRRPDRRLKIPRPTSCNQHLRSKSAKQQHRNIRNKEHESQFMMQHPAPFMSYGWADNETNLCQHRTFNVRATADVHPAALRAQSRRRTVAEQRTASAQRTAENRLKAMLEATVRHRAEQDGEWLSEYQQRYPAYDKSEYLRSVSARANERKLCRVVHVS